MEQERVLVVDDDEAFCNLMVSHLQRRGYSVEKAHNGVEGLQVLQARGPFAVLVSDLAMPRMGGLELLREALKIDFRLEVIVITATGSIESAVSAMREDGAYDYLLKPLEDVNELSFAVGRAASHRRLRLEREVLQARLAAEAERLRAVIASTGDAILSADIKNVITVVNPAACQLLGPAAAVGANALSGLPPPIATLVANWQSLPTAGPTMVEVTWPAQTVQMVNLTPIPGKNGQPIGWVMSMRDITHLRRLGELKMRFLDEMAQKVQLPLAQTITALAELKEVAESRGGRASEAYYRLVKLWGRIQDWAEDLLSVIRVELGVGLKPTDVDLPKAIEGMKTTLVDGLVKSKGLKLDINILSQVPVIRVDASLLLQLLQGLISRAATRSRRGGQVRLSIREHKGQVWIDVSDDGPPVDDADLPHLFEKSFAQININAESTGLELVKVKSIIDRIGGQVWVAGQGKVGSTIAVYLPSNGNGNGNRPSTGRLI